MTIRFLLFVLVGALLWVKLRQVRSAFFIVSSLLALGLAYMLYTDIFPGDSHFRNEFERKFDVEFPDSGEILFKKADWPALFGENESCAMFEVNEGELGPLEKLIGDGRTDSDFSLSSDCRDFLYSEYGQSRIDYYKRQYWEESGQYRELGILADRRHVIYLVVSR